MNVDTQAQAQKQEPIQLRTEEEVKDFIFNFIRDNFHNPAELLAWVDDDLNNGTYYLYDWQKRIHHTEFSLDHVYTSQNPLELCIRAVNGSGKDEKVIAPFAVFLIATNKTARAVITSSSSRQMDHQTEKYIARFANILNKKLSRLVGLDSVHEFFIVQKRKIVCTFADDSEILMFVTDEEGQAEGYHPLKAGAVFAMVMNEAKSIEENLWGAFLRCNGYTHWIEVSSPGKPDGHFYKKCISTRTITTQSGEIKAAVVQYVVQSDDCPHLGGELYKQRLLEDLGSIDNPIYKSMVNCDFSSADEQVVIDSYKYQRLIQYQKFCEHIHESKNKGGLDLAFGGDEIVLQVRNGNKHIGTEKLKSKDTAFICKTIVDWFKKWDLLDSVVYADAGGLGDVIISLLSTTYNCKCIKRIKNNWVASNENIYDNLGTEMWFQLAKLIEQQEIILAVDDDVLRKQLCNRYYNILPSNITQLESKQKARAKGRASPDRADALVLAFFNYKSPKQQKTNEAEKKRINDYFKNKLNSPLTIQKVIERQSKQEQFRYKYNYAGTISAKRRLEVNTALRRELVQNLSQALLTSSKQIQNN